MKIETQNRWPSLSLDIGEVNNLLSPFFAAGFYYKTFMWPKAAWHQIYEPFIRRAAGLGMRRRKRIRIITPTATPIATCSSSVAVLPVSRRRSLPPRRACAS